MTSYLESWQFLPDQHGFTHHGPSYFTTQTKTKMDVTQEKTPKESEVGPGNPSRRKLLKKAGWTIPAVIGLSLVNTASAISRVDQPVEEIELEGPDNKGKSLENRGKGRGKGKGKGLSK
jgi:hypothetical protein